MPPDDKLSALLRVIYVATIEIRAAAWQSEREETVEGKRVALDVCAAMADAVHNIPLFLNDWEKWDETAFLNIIRVNAKKMAGKRVSDLEAVYRDAIARHGSNSA